MASTFDIEHAAFVRQEYRREVATSTTVKARNATAREIAFDTNLDQANALRIANNILADNVKPRAFEIEVEGTLGTNPLAGGPPSFVINSPRRNISLYSAKAFSITEDYEKNTTVYQVRG